VVIGVLSPETKAEVHDAIKRVMEGRERVPADLPYPPSINDYMLLAVWPDEDPKRSQFSKPGRALTRATMQIYLAGFFAGRVGDEQVGAQVREALDIPQAETRSTYHPHIGLAVCLVCDGAPEDQVHVEPGEAVTRRV
jgi:hypothetical protein